jgi:hypothetical protein
MLLIINLYFEGLVQDYAILYFGIEKVVIFYVKLKNT